MKRLMHAMLIIAMLAGCGGGESPAPTVAGVAAAGTPLVGTVTLKDSSSTPKELSIATDFRGSFSFNVSGLTAPFLLQAAGTASGNNYTIYSMATNAGNCNINPLTHLTVTMANGGQDPSGIYSNPTPAQIAAISAALPQAVADIQDKLAPIFSQIEASPVNVITDQMTANGQGLDLLFDMVSITVGDGSVSTVNKSDGGIILPSTSIASGVLSGNPNVSIMSPVFTITGSVTRAGTGLPGRVVEARSKAPSYPHTPVILVRTNAQGNYELLVPNGTYQVCGYAAGFILGRCVDVTVSNANVTGINIIWPIG